MRQGDEHLLPRVRIRASLRLTTGQAYPACAPSMPSQVPASLLVGLQEPYDTHHGLG